MVLDAMLWVKLQKLHLTDMKAQSMSNISQQVTTSHLASEVQVTHKAFSDMRMKHISVLAEHEMNVNKTEKINPVKQWLKQLKLWLHTQTQFHGSKKNQHERKKQSSWKIMIQ